MLQTIRDKAQGWFAYLVVAFISVPFVFWGIQQYVGSSDGRVAAKVNGVEIPVLEFQRALQNYNQRLREMFGGQLPAEMLKGDLAQQAVVSGMVREYVKQQYTVDSGFRVSDEQLLAEIRSTPIFQDGGKFNPKKYDQILSQQRLSKAGFEQQMRQDLLGGQIDAALVASAFMTPPESAEFGALQAQRRDIRFGVIDKQRFASGLSVDEAAINDFFQRNQAAYMTPERVKLEYVLLDEKELGAQISVNDDELRRFYDEYAERFTKPEARRVSHILVRAVDASDPSSVEKSLKDAREEAGRLVQQLKSGAAFDEVARAHSDDSLSASKGGDLGLIGKGEFDPDVEAAIFSLERGAVSEPVRSSNGYRIFKVTEVASAESRPFEAVRSDVEREFRQRQLEKLLIEKSESLATLTYENPDSLAVAAEALGVTVQTTDWVSAEKGDGIAADPKVRGVAFSEPVLRQKHNSDVLNLGGGRDVVVRVLQHEVAQPVPLDQVKDSIRARLVEDGLRDAAIRAGEQAVADARKDGFDSVANGLGVTIKSPGLVGRESKDVPQEILQAAFRIGKPQSADKPISGGVPLADGNYAVLQVLNVVQPDAAAVQTSAPGNKSAGAFANRQVEAVFDAAQSRAQVEIFAENLTQ